MSTSSSLGSAASDTAGNPDLIYVNGINPDTGTYAMPPLSMERLARIVRGNPGGKELLPVFRAEQVRWASVPGVDMSKPEEAGWAVIFPENTPADIQNALKPLLDRRRAQAGPLFKMFDYKDGDQVRNWLDRQKVSPGSFDRRRVPYYLLLVGPPTSIPFDFQYLLGIEYAVGRLAFDTAGEYEVYARSLIDYETAASVGRKKEIAFWGTQHPGDAATAMSASLLVDALANGVADGNSSLDQPVHAEFGYSRCLCGRTGATKNALLGLLCSRQPPALLFTASHGMAMPCGDQRQSLEQGALLCQDWPGYGGVRREHYLAASDVPDDANVRGLISFHFACFSAGTPKIDQFLTDPSAAPEPLAPAPFVAALPRRLLSHPKGAALAVVGHVDRAWGFSIQSSAASGPQIMAFHDTLGYILTGCPVGHAIAMEFGQRYSALSAILLSALSPTAPDEMRMSDRELVTRWLERNDAQDYVMLGDPAARVRPDVLTC